MKAIPRPVVLAISLIVIWAALTLIVFVKLEQRTQDQIRKLVGSWANNFTLNWLSRPNSEPHLFRRMKNDFFIPLIDSQPLFQNVILTWRNPVTAKESILYPWELIGQPIEQVRTADTIRHALIDPYDMNQQEIGALYFILNPWEKRATSFIFLLAAVNILLLVLILLTWLSRLSSRYAASVSELEQKKLELIQLEQLALAGRLTAGLLHDLKKPVLHIREESREDATPERLKDIQMQSELFLSMLRDSGLENFSRSRSLEAEYCDVLDLVERSLRLVEYEREDVHVDVQTEGEVPLVHAHPTRLVQVFSNLILNAYQALKGHGELKILIRSCLVGEDSHAEIRFIDNGPGISSSLRDRVFEPFFSTGKEGSGLGLYIVKTIIEGYGGSIRIEELPEYSGTCFIVLIPEKTQPSLRS